jgi:hypothetical protein
MEPGLSAVAFFSAPHLQPPDADDRVSSSSSHGFIADVAVVEVTGIPEQCASSTT